MGDSFAHQPDFLFDLFDADQLPGEGMGGKAFQHRLCQACDQLADLDAAHTIEQILQGVTVDRSEMSERIQLGVAFEGEA